MLVKVDISNLANGGPKVSMTYVLRSKSNVRSYILGRPTLFFIYMMYSGWLAMWLAQSGAWIRAELGSMALVVPPFDVVPLAAAYFALPIRWPCTQPKYS